MSSYRGSPDHLKSNKYFTEFRVLPTPSPPSLLLLPPYPLSGVVEHLLPGGVELQRLSVIGDDPLFGQSDRLSGHLVDLVGVLELDGCVVCFRLGLMGRAGVSEYTPTHPHTPPHTHTPIQLVDLVSLLEYTPTRPYPPTHPLSHSPPNIHASNRTNNQASKFVKIHGSKLLLLSLRAGSKTIFVVAIFNVRLMALSL